MFADVGLRTSDSVFGLLFLFEQEYVGTLCTIFASSPVNLEWIENLKSYFEKRNLVVQINIIIQLYWLNIITEQPLCAKHYRGYGDG